MKPGPERAQMLIFVAVGWLLLGLWLLLTNRTPVTFACFLLAVLAGGMAWRDRRGARQRM